MATPRRPTPAEGPAAQGAPKQSRRAGPTHNKKLMSAAAWGGAGRRARGLGRRRPGKHRRGEEEAEGSAGCSARPAPTAGGGGGSGKRARLAALLRGGEAGGGGERAGCRLLRDRPGTGGHLASPAATLFARALARAQRAHMASLLGTLRPERPRSFPDTAGSVLPPPPGVPGQGAGVSFSAGVDRWG